MTLSDPVIFILMQKDAFYLFKFFKISNCLSMNKFCSYSNGMKYGSPKTVRKEEKKEEGKEKNSLDWLVVSE
jgi:hypothetical protein